MNWLNITLIIFILSINIFYQIKEHLQPPDIKSGQAHQKGGVSFSSPPQAVGQEETLNKADPPVFSHKGGFYETSIELNISTATKNSKIFYTTDGSVPTSKSKLYKNPIIIDQTTVIRARVYAFSHSSRSKKELALQPSDIVTQTFFIKYKSNLPVISIATNPDNLWNDTTGIYVKGLNADTVRPYYGANFWKDWEKPAYVEFYEPNSELGFSMNTGIKIFGGWSRAFPQKSFAIHARSKYGETAINYQLFQDKNIKSYKSFVLRNSGGDFGRTLFRDALMTYMVKNLDIEIQAYRPVVVFLNGEYWGIYSMREKINEHFIADNCNISKDSIDLLEHRGTIIKCGDNKHYFNMLSFMRQHDLSIDSNYQHVQTLMDVENYMKYIISEIYFDNEDMGGNIRYWRPRTKLGRWRWILYDTDWGFGLYNKEAYKANTLAFATEPNGPPWPNPPWSTFILRKLLENESFKIQFINCFADVLNTIFKPEIVIFKINIFQEQLEQEITNHLKKWGRTKEQWLSDIETLRKFALYRPFYLRKYILEKFSLSDTIKIEVKIIPPNSGFIHLSSIKISEPFWQGIYFADVPITLNAVSALGYNFVRWEQFPPPLPQQSNEENEKRENIIITPTKDISLTAKFEQKPLSEYHKQIIFTEICYYSSDSINCGDWIEIYNQTDKFIDLSDWILINKKYPSQAVQLPANTIIEKNNCLVLCQDTSLFSSVYPEILNKVGNFTFNLDTINDFICLFDKEGRLVDSVHFTASAVPLGQLSQKPLISLTLRKNSTMLMSQNRCWVFTDNATPGKYIIVKETFFKNKWFLISAIIGISVILVLLYIRIFVKNSSGHTCPVR